MTQHGGGGDTRMPMVLPTQASITATQIVSEAEVLHGRPNVLRVFISSEMRSGTLKEDRLIAAAVIEQHPDTEPWLWEANANAGQYSSLDVCVGCARTSDILLLILGKDLTPTTEAEWRAAKSAGTNCALLLKTVRDRTTHADSFIAAERQDGIDVRYTDVEELRQAVQAVLRRCVTDAVRRRALARRWHGTTLGHGASQLLEAGINRAEQLYWAGSVVDATSILDELDVLIGERRPRSPDHEIITGLVQGAVGQPAKAIAAYWRVIANRSSSIHALAVAHQNLGLEAMRAGHIRLATQQMKLALKKHRDAADWFGVLQVTLNMGNFAIDNSDLDAASSFADLADQLLTYFVDPLPRQRAGVLALRSHIAGGSGRHEDALRGYKAVYTISLRQHGWDGQAVSAQNVAAAYHNLGKFQLARSWASKSLELANASGVVWRIEAIHRFLGVLEWDDQRLEEALKHFEAARSVAASVCDDWRVATLTAHIGAVLLDSGSDHAETVLDEAYQLLNALGDLKWAARVDMNRARLALMTGRSEDALRYYQAVASASKADRDLRIAAHEHIGDVYVGLNNQREAAGAYKSAVRLRTADNSKAVAAASYAHRLQNGGFHGAALNMFDGALRIARADGDKADLCDIQADRALLVAQNGDTPNALAQLEECLDLARGIRDSERKVRALHNIGELARRVGDNRRSLRALQQARTLAAKAGDDVAFRSVSGLLAMAQLSSGRTDDAKTTASDLLDATTRTGERSGRSVAFGVLAGVSFAGSEFNEAAYLYRRASRLNADQPVQHAEDLCGILESHAAADRWRPVVRAAQVVVNYAQSNGQESLAWPSLLRAARRYLNRGQQSRAASLTVPAWVLASQVSKPKKRRRQRQDEERFADSEFVDALLTTAFHELWSGYKPCDLLYAEVIKALGLDEADPSVREWIESARSTALNVDRRSGPGKGERSVTRRP